MYIMVVVTDPNAFNYNDITVDDGSCIEKNIHGCSLTKY